MSALLALLVAAVAAEGDVPEADAPLLPPSETQPAPVGTQTADKFGLDQLRTAGAGNGITYDFSLRTEGRAATATPTVPSTPAAPVKPNLSNHELQLDGLASATLRDGRFSFTAAYLPRILFELPGDQGNATDILHTGRLAANYTLSRIQSLGLEENFSVGHQDFSPLVAAAPGAAQTGTAIDPSTANLQSVPVTTSSTSLNYHQAITPNLGATGRVSFNLSGSLNRAYQAQIPIQRGGQADTSFSWSATTHDVFSLSGTGSFVNFSGYALSKIPDPTSFDPTNPLTGIVIATPTSIDVTTLGASGVWSHDLGRETRASLQLGAGSAHTTDASTGTIQGWVPTFQGELNIGTSVSFGRQRVALSAGGGVSAIVDRLTANIYELADARASADFAPITELHLTASGSGGYALNGASEAGQALGVFELSTRILFSKVVSFSIGARASVQHQPTVAPAAGSGATQGNTLPSGSQFAGYATLSFSEHGNL